MRVSATYALEMLIQKYWQHARKKKPKAEQWTRIRTPSNPSWQGRGRPIISLKKFAPWSQSNTPTKHKAILKIQVLWVSDCLIKRATSTIYKGNHVKVFVTANQKVSVDALKSWCSIKNNCLSHSIIESTKAITIVRLEQTRYCPSMPLYFGLSPMK